MEVVILETENDVATWAADRISDLLVQKPDATLGLATGNTPLALYRRLSDRFAKGLVSFKNVKTFNLDEYIGIEEGNHQSYRTYMRKEFFGKVDIPLENTHLPYCSATDNPREVGSAYEHDIETAGGIDLQLFGIGANGHIGFNEPTSSFGSRTRVKTLTKRTISENSRLFSPEEFQPHLAMTMGIATILDSRRVWLMATGQHKAEAVGQAIEGPISSMVPASALQLHESATVIVDRSAASKLKHIDYYNWAVQEKTKLARKFDTFP